MNTDIDGHFNPDQEMLMGGTSLSAPSTPTRQAEYGAISNLISNANKMMDNSMFNNNINNDIDDTTIEVPAPQRPPIDHCLWVFHFVEGLTAISAFLLFLTQMAPLVLFNAKSQQQQQQHFHQDLNFVAIIERIYISVFCTLVVITESDAPIPIVRDSQILQNYISRGFLYSFIGIICLQESYSERVKGLLSDSAGFHILWSALFMEISAWWMLVMGMLYMALGILCMKLLRDRMVEREQRNWTRYRKEMEEWKRRRDQQQQRAL